MCVLANRVLLLYKLLFVINSFNKCSLNVYKHILKVNIVIDVLVVVKVVEIVSVCSLKNNLCDTMSVFAILQFY